MTQHRSFSIADYLLTPLKDGVLELGAEMFPNLSSERASECLQNIGQTDGPVSGTLNSYLLQTQDNNILIDAGGGAFMPSTGNLVHALDKLGLKPSDIHTVLCTHLHPDHVGGLIADGNSVFQEANIVVHPFEIDFWRSDKNRANAPDMFEDFFNLANSVLDICQEQISTLQVGQSVLPGIEAVHLPGHTPGHCGFQIGHGSDGLLVWGDIVHVAAFQMPCPDASIAFDVDFEQAVKTRHRMFEQTLADKTLIAGMHLDHPGLGQIVRKGSGFWMEPWEPDHRAVS